MIDWEQLYYDQHRVIQHLRSRVQTLEADLSRSRNDSGLGGYAWPEEDRNPFAGQVHTSTLPRSRTSSMEIVRSNGQSATGGLQDRKARTEVHMSEDVHKSEVDTPKHAPYSFKRPSQTGTATALSSIPENVYSSAHDEIKAGQHIDSGMIVTNGLSLPQNQSRLTNY